MFIVNDGFVLYYKKYIFDYDGEFKKKIFLVWFIG